MPTHRPRCGGDGQNDGIVIFGSFAEGSDPVAGGCFRAGSGVSQSNGALLAVGDRLGDSYNGASDVAWAYGPTESAITKRALGAKIVFDIADVRAITLWNSDASLIGRVQEAFERNAAQSAYTFHHYG